MLPERLQVPPFSVTADATLGFRLLDAGGAERKAGGPQGAGPQEAGPVAAAGRPEGGGGGALLCGGDGLLHGEAGEGGDAHRQ